MDPPPPHLVTFSKQNSLWPKKTTLFITLSKKTQLFYFIGQNNYQNRQLWTQVPVFLSRGGLTGPPQLSQLVDSTMGLHGRKSASRRDRGSGRIFSSYFSFVLFIWFSFHKLDWPWKIDFDLGLILLSRSRQAVYSKKYFFVSKTIFPPHKDKNSLWGSRIYVLGQVLFTMVYNGRLFFLSFKNQCLIFISLPNQFEGIPCFNFFVALGLMCAYFFFTFFMRKLALSDGWVFSFLFLHRSLNSIKNYFKNHFLMSKNALGSRISSNLMCRVYFFSRGSLTSISLDSKCDCWSICQVVFLPFPFHSAYLSCPFLGLTPAPMILSPINSISSPEPLPWRGKFCFFQCWCDGSCHDWWIRMVRVGWRIIFPSYHLKFISPPPLLIFLGMSKAPRFSGILPREASPLLHPFSRLEGAVRLGWGGGRINKTQIKIWKEM